MKRRSRLQLAAMALGAYLLVSGIAFFAGDFSDVELLKTYYPVVRYEGPGEAPTVTLEQSRPRGWVNLSQVSRVAVGAIIVSEDWAFYQHKGYDPKQIRDAIEEDIKAGRFARGASTITQQVAKNVFLTRKKSVWRKIKELTLAIEMEKEVGKRKILESYLNVAEWGEGIYGINKASWHYFKKGPGSLNAKEGAFLAMLLPSPKRYGVSYRNRQLTRFASRTVNSILRKMAAAGYITHSDRMRWVGAPLSFERVNRHAGIPAVGTETVSDSGTVTGEDGPSDETETDTSTESVAEVAAPDPHPSPPTEFEPTDPAALDPAPEAPTP